MYQNQTLTTRLLSLRNQIKVGAFLLILAVSALAFTLLKGLRDTFEIARSNAASQEIADRLYAIDKKLLDEYGSGKSKVLAGESISDDLAKLQKLMGTEERLSQLQALAEKWNLTSEETVTKMRGLLKELLRSQAQIVIDRQAEAEKINRQVLITVGLLLLSIGAILILVSQHLSRRISESSQQLLLAMERLSVGDITPQIEDRAHDEFGLLARTFNRMATQLSERQSVTLLRNRELDELYYFNTMLQTSESEHEIHKALLQKIRAMTLTQAVVFDWNLQARTLVAVATLYPLPKNKPDGSAISYEIPLCRVVRAGREIVLPNLSEDLMCTDCHFGQPHGSAYCSPIIAGGKPIGALHLISPEIDYWTAERQRFIKALVDQAGSAINNLRLRDQLEGRVFMDEHTQVYNRRYLDDHLRKEFAAAERAQRPLCVLMLDIDYFKRFNDTYGHEAGDIVLRQFARAIKNALREHEIVARYGGEEFTVVMEGNSREAQVVAERLRRAIAALSFKQFTTHGEDVRITMSIGIAEFPSSGHTLEEILKAADLALYQAKDAGRNCVKVATKTLLAVRAAMQ